MPGELSLVKFLADILFKLAGLRTEQRNDVSTYLAEIADMLTAFGPAFRQDNRQQTNSLAAQTQVVAAKFGEVAKGTLDEKQIKTFGNDLQAAYNETSQRQRATTRGATTEAGRDCANRRSFPGRVDQPEGNGESARIKHGRGQSIRQTLLHDLGRRRGRGLSRHASRKLQSTGGTCYRAIIIRTLSEP